MVPTGRLGFHCASCGEMHEGLPAIAFPSPSLWHEDYEDRDDCFLDTDFCKIDTHYFIRTNLELPIVGESETLSIGLWLSQSEANFELYRKTFHASPDHASVCWIVNQLPDYPNMSGLMAKAYCQADGFRPILELDDVDHPLVEDWRKGLTVDAAVAMVSPVLPAPDERAP